MLPRRYVQSRVYRVLIVLFPAVLLLRLYAVENSAGYEFRQNHDPDGIGKFYLGREIAAVMGQEAADWLDRPERQKEEHTDEVVRYLKLLPGQVVADIGAGTGYYTERMARQVGPEGRVLAVDIQTEMLTLLTNRMKSIGITNVVPVLGTDTDPRLPQGRIDLVLMVDVYHEFAFPVEMMNRICRALKPHARVVFVEFKDEASVPIKRLHKMSEAQLKKEMAVQPLKWVGTYGALPWQNVFIFIRR